MKIFTVIGARPQFVKAAAVSRVLRSYSGVKEVLVHTGQHFDQNMSDIFFEEMEIPQPDFFLNIHSSTHGAMTGQMLEKIEELLLKEKPDKVMVYGDTNSTLAGALAACKLHIPIAHVEAGLRSFNMNMPEEINRILTDRVSSLLFCPTETSIQNLKNEGFDKIKCKIIRTGDVMYDAAMYYAQKAKAKSTIINKLNIKGKPNLLVTIHRAENTDDKSRLRSIIQALNQLSGQYKIILPLHPRTAKIIHAQSIPLYFQPIEPVGYFDMIELLRNCSMVLTDSGGLQKEAYFFKKFCVTLREQTEWLELVENNYNKLAGTNSDSIMNAVSILSKQSFSDTVALYGDGNSAKEISEEIIKTSA